MNEPANLTPLVSAGPRPAPLTVWAHKALDNWLQRHRLPFNFWIHVIGIPLAAAGVFLFFIADWYWAVAAIVVGYALQWLGHLAEGNDLGEWAGIKKLLGLPYVGISPRWSREDDKVTR
jgi:2-hydroxy-palmitic acid dioxygenase Mpo1-like